MLEGHLRTYYERAKPRQRRLAIVDQFDPARPEVSQFSLAERRYLKHLYPEEVGFMRYLLPTKAKFLPAPGGDWVGEHLRRPDGSPPPGGASQGASRGA
jgi:hypothetical protein